MKAIGHIGGLREWPSFAGRRLGIEVTPASLIVVEIGRRAMSKAAQIPLPAAVPASAIPVRTLLRQERIGRAPVHLGICDTGHAHRLLLVPPMTAREHAEVASRETARDGEDDRVSAWSHLRRLEVDGLPKDELLIVSAPAASVQPALDSFVAEQMAPRVVVSGPVALIAAARSLAPSPLDAPTALVHWGVSTLMIVVVSDGVFRFARVVTPPAADLDPLGWMPVEIDRSIRHYAIQSKGARVEHVMVSVAEASAARRLFGGAGLAERLRLPLTNLNALLAPQLPASSDTEGAGVFTIAYGVALLRPGETPNLLPPALVFQRRSRQVTIASVAANAAATFVLASAWLSASQDAGSLRARLEQAEASVRARETRLAVDARAADERQQMRQRARLLTDDPLKLLPVGDALKEIARLAPGPVRLDQLTVSTEAQTYVLTLTGGVHQPDIAEAQRHLNRFYYGLRASPLFYDVRIQQPSLQTVAAARASGPGAPAGSSAATGSGDAGTGTAGDEQPRSTPFVLVLKLRRLA